MKLNKFICAALTVGAVVFSAGSVFAADTVKIGGPIDLTTGKAATDLVKDQVILVPVDITTESGATESVEFYATYDTSVLTPGFADVYEDANADTATALESYGDVILDANTETIATAVGAFKWTAGKKNLIGDTAYIGNPAAPGQTVSLMVAAAKTFSTTADADFYLVFTVKAAPASDALNTKLVDAVADKININDAGYSKTENSTEAKANACAGAFKVSIDSATVPKYVHALYVSFDDGATKQDIADYVVTGSVYDFPVRVLSTKSETSVTAKIYADLGTTESKVDETVEIGTVTVDLTGTATDYSTSATTNIK